MKKQTKKESNPEKEFTFSKIFSKSIEEYKSNFKGILKFMLIFSGIILVVSALFQILTMSFDKEILELISNPELINSLIENTIQIPSYYIIITLIIGITSFLLSVFVSAGLINSSVKNSKLSFKEIIKKGKEKYWKFLGFSIVIGIFTFLLSLAFLIPGIIFGVFWVFAAYVFFEENKGIINSLKTSKKIVKRRWWKTFGYMMLFILITFLVISVISLVKAPVTMINLKQTLLQQFDVSLSLLIATKALETLYLLIVNIILVPFSILFFKNFYFEMKKTIKNPLKPKTK